MVIFKITRVLLNRHNTYLINVLEYQKMGIILELYKSNCDIDKFFLEQDKINISNMQEKLINGNMSDIEINNLINNINKLYYKNKS